MKARVKVQPLTPERWADFVQLFGRNGACAGCWCMWWRLPHRQWLRGKGPANRRAIRRLVGTGEVPGLLAYLGGEPIGWVAVAPRVAYARLATSRTLKPVDNQPVWSIPCFFVAKTRRRRGVSQALLRAAVEYARRQGARVVEGYPVEPNKPQPDVFVYTGLASTFRRVGFREVARRSPTRPIFRIRLSGAVKSRSRQSRAGS